MSEWIKLYAAAFTHPSNTAPSDTAAPGVAVTSRSALCPRPNFTAAPPTAKIA